MGLVAQFAVVPFLKNKINKEFEPQKSCESVEIQRIEREDRSMDSSEGKTTPVPSSCKLLTTELSNYEFQEIFPRVVPLVCIAVRSQ